MTQIFIDGAAGTTGLEIESRLAGRAGLRMITLDDANRKDKAKRADALNAADIAILCLPDDAARDAVAMVRNSRTRIIDASSAHRVSAGWTYGFPELGFNVAGAQRVSNPGCYPTGFLAMIRPLVAAGLIPADWPISVHAVSGYSGGGKAMIAQFDADPDLAYRGYALSLAHKHVPEMQIHSGLTHPPLFSPAVIPAFRGMVVEVPVHLALLPGKPGRSAMLDVWHRHYDMCPLIQVHDDHPTEVVLRKDASASDALHLYCCTDSGGQQARLVAMLDNLGKGASGACLQSLNLMAGLPQTEGLML